MIFHDCTDHAANVFPFVLANDLKVPDMQVYSLLSSSSAPAICTIENKCRIEFQFIFLHNKHKMVFYVYLWVRGLKFVLLKQLFLFSILVVFHFSYFPFWSSWEKPIASITLHSVESDWVDIISLSRINFRSFNWWQNVHMFRTSKKI